MCIYQYDAKFRKLMLLKIVSSHCAQVWQLGSSSPNFTLEGHEKGINCVDYFQGGDKPYLISGADDRYFPFVMDDIIITSF